MFHSVNMPTLVCIENVSYVDYTKSFIVHLFSDIITIPCYKSVVFCHSQPLKVTDIIIRHVAVVVVNNKSARPLDRNRSLAN